MADYTDLLQDVSYHSSCNSYIPLLPPPPLPLLLQETVYEYFLRCHWLPLSVIRNLLLLFHCQCCYFALHQDNFLKLGGLFITEVHSKVQIGTQHGGWQKCEMADYLYSVAIQANLLHNNMANKTFWLINWGHINDYSLYLLPKIHV